MLIVLEGLDGSGKSTQLKKTTDYIASLGKEVEYLHFPRYAAPVYGNLISRFLRGEFGSVNQVHPQLVALLFAEDRHGAALQIKSWIEKGKVVVLDRYVYSNIAFQCAKLTDRNAASVLREWISDTEYRQFGIPRPDLNIFLDVPIDFVDERLASNRKDDNDRDYLEGKEDIHEADITFQMKVREMYLEQCNADPSFLRVDCRDNSGRMLPADDIFSKIKALIDNIICD